MIKITNHDGVDDTWDEVTLNGQTIIDIFHPSSNNSIKDSGLTELRISSEIDTMDVEEAEEFLEGLQLAIDKAKELNKKVLNHDS